MYYLLLLCAIVSCRPNADAAEVKQPAQRIVATAVPNDPRGSLSIDPELFPLVDKFEAIWGNKIKTPIWFSFALPKNVLALCHTFTRSDGLVLTEIIVAREAFKPATTQAEITIFHELGHCELKRGHDQSLARTEDGKFVAFSIMYPTVIDDDDYEKYLDHYMLELFSRGTLLIRYDGDDD
jgi:hypothetical protein